jgi:protein gp37
MSSSTSIEWTDATWNPVTGCDEVSPGCDNCYAKTFAERWRGTPGHHFERGFDVVLRPQRLDEPLRWRKPRRVFVNSMSDLFHDAIPDEYIARVFAVMARTPQHTYQILTKRHGRMRSLLKGVDGSGHRLLEAATDEDTAQALYDAWPLPNVWLGVSVEDQQRADLRIPALLDTPAAVRWLSCEPLLGPVDLTEVAPGLRYSNRGFNALAGDPAIDWVVVGGESGHRARPMEPAWARALRDQCVGADVPFFFKQWGEHVVRDQMTDDAIQAWDSKYGCDVYDSSVQWRVGKKAAGRDLDGRTWDQYPQAALAGTGA